MPELKPTVYIETSVISYLTARQSRDLIVAAHQQIPRDWWETALPKYKAVISPTVLEEIAKGDSQAAQKRLDRVSSFTILELTREVRTIAEIFCSN